MYSAAAAAPANLPRTAHIVDYSSSTDRPTDRTDLLAYAHTHSHRETTSERTSPVHMENAADEEEVVAAAAAAAAAAAPKARALNRV